MIRTDAEMETITIDHMRDGAGTVSVKHMFKRDEFTANSRLCAKLTLPPGASIGKHEHLTEDEVYIITAGSGLLDDGTSETRVVAGDAVLTGNGESHAIRNDGEVPLEITAVIMCYPGA
jgi:mannose-6-phosphate isomerase-like protein (cupin superfamily)